MISKSKKYLSKKSGKKSRFKSIKNTAKNIAIVLASTAVTAYLIDRMLSPTKHNNPVINFTPTLSKSPKKVTKTKYLSVQEIEDIYSPDKIKDTLILQWVSIPNIKLIVWDYDKTILKEYSYRSFQLNDPYLFIHFVLKAVEFKIPVAIASFNRTSTIIPHMKDIFSIYNCCPFDQHNIITAKHLGRPEGEEFENGKPMMLDYLRSNNHPKIDNKSSIILFDDKEFNIRQCHQDNYLNAIYLPNGFNYKSLNNFNPKPFVRSSSILRITQPFAESTNRFLSKIHPDISFSSSSETTSKSPSQFQAQHLFSIFKSPNKPNSPKSKSLSNQNSISKNINHREFFQKITNFSYNKGVAFTILFFPELNNTCLVLKLNYDNNRWSLPGGNIDNGEDSYEASIREFKEEVGIDLSKFNPIPLKFLKPNDKTNIFIYYSLSNPESILKSYKPNYYFGKITSKDNEVSHWGLMTLDEQNELVLYFSNSVSMVDRQKLLEGKTNNSNIFRTSKSLKSQYIHAIKCLNSSKNIDPSTSTHTSTSPNPSIKHTFPMEFKRHIDQRIKDLEIFIRRHHSHKVIIASVDGKISSLGTGYAKEQWNDSGYSTQQYDNFMSYLNKKINNLSQTYSSQVSFEKVSYEKANNTTYCVWGANKSNWNLPDGSIITGSGQAIYMKRQKKGVFGIVTTPVAGLP